MRSRIVALISKLFASSASSFTVVIFEEEVAVDGVGAVCGFGGAGIWKYAACEVLAINIETAMAANKLFMAAVPFCVSEPLREKFFRD